MLELYDTFNKRTVSRHRTIEAAIRADKKLQARVRKFAGPTSFIPTEVRGKDGTPVDDRAYCLAEANVEDPQR